MDALRCTDTPLTTSGLRPRLWWRAQFTAACAHHHSQDLSKSDMPAPPACSTSTQQCARPRRWLRRPRLKTAMAHLKPTLSTASSWVAGSPAWSQPRCGSHLGTACWPPTDLRPHLTWSSCTAEAQPETVRLLLHAAYIILMVFNRSPGLEWRWRMDKYARMQSLCSSAAQRQGHWHHPALTPLVAPVVGTVLPYPFH